MESFKKIVWNWQDPLPGKLNFGVEQESPNQNTRMNSCITPSAKLPVEKKLYIAYNKPKRFNIDLVVKGVSG